MLTPERHQIIIDLVKEKGVVKLQELVDVTEASESTIRRDLSQLEEEKKLKRIHGGAAQLNQKGEELSILEKSSQQIAEKDAIGKYAASLIQDNDCIFLDAGTTTGHIIPYIEAKNIKVVTNGLTHLELLFDKEIETYLVGGLVKLKTKALIGKGAIDSILNYRFDKSFIGVNGIHLQYGFTTPDPEEAIIKKNAIHLAQETFILADSTKFNNSTFAKVAELNEGSIITNEEDLDIIGPYKEKTQIKVVTS